MTHLSPIEHWVGRVLQGCHTATQILDVVEVVLDRLADDVGPAAVELLGRRIQLSTKGNNAALIRPSSPNQSASAFRIHSGTALQALAMQKRSVLKGFTNDRAGAPAVRGGNACP